MSARPSRYPEELADRCVARVHRGNYGFACRCLERSLPADTLCRRHRNRIASGLLVYEHATGRELPALSPATQEQK